MGIDLFRTRFATASKDQLRWRSSLITLPRRGLIQMAKSQIVYVSNCWSSFLVNITRKGSTELFSIRSEIIQVADELNIKLPKNIGDILYSFRYRVQFTRKYHQDVARRTGMDYPPGWERPLWICNGSQFDNNSQSSPWLRLRFLMRHLGSSINMRSMMSRHYWPGCVITV